MNPSPDREMLVELVGLHARAMLRMPWIQALLVTGIGLFVYIHLPPALFLSWGALTIAVEYLRRRYAARVLQRGDTIDPKRTHACFVGFAALAGASIGIGAAAFLPRLPLLHQALLGATLFAIPAAGAAVSQSSPYILASYASTFLIPATVTWGILHPSQAVGMAVLTPLYLIVIVLVAADGEKLLARSVAIRHERDRLVRSLEQRNADVQAARVMAEQSAQARARVLAAASHDLRQPLHALSVYSAVLASDPAPELLKEVSQNIDQIVRALGSLLNGLLDLSRLSAGLYVPEDQIIDLPRLIASICAEYQQAALQKGLAFAHDLRMVRVRGDAVAIGRIARNLIDNAIKYTDQGNVTVTVRGESDGETSLAVLEVTDTGKGIPESEHGKIFEEFYQLDNPGRDRSRGVGLGLAIVQRLCELTGATIGVKSVVGSGTCFRVSMRAWTEDSLSPEAVPGPPEESSLQGVRVYVVDDETDILKSMRTLLKLWGAEVRTADCRDAADALFDQHATPDALIIDLRIGGDEHGAEIADRLQRRYGSFPVLIITGETASEALRQARERGYPLLQKPVQPEVLRRAIGAALHRPR